MTKKPRQPRADAGKKRGPYKPPSLQISIRIPPDLAKRLEDHQSELDPIFTRNSTILDAIRTYLDIQDLPGNGWDIVNQMIRDEKK